MEKKTSEKWYELCAVEIIDPDGWDRKNFHYSWYEEEITKEEFEKRTLHSTLIGGTEDSIWKKEADLHDQEADPETDRA